jgi:hypothetical protein
MEVLAELIQFRIGLYQFRGKILRVGGSKADPFQSMDAID